MPGVRYRGGTAVRFVWAFCAVTAVAGIGVSALPPGSAIPSGSTLPPGDGDRAAPLRKPPAEPVLAVAALKGAAPVDRSVRLQIPPGRNALILADRRTIQRLGLAKKLLDQKDYVKAAELLQRVVERDKDAFYYPDPEKRVSLQSVRTSAQRMIGSMPKPGRDAYRLKYGVTAKVLLAEAAKAGNVGQIAEIARRYFHTEAGYSAMYRLGILHFDQGRPLAAALCFEKLRRLPEAARKREPILSLRTAVCWHRAGVANRVQSALESVKRAAAGRPVVVGGRPVELFASLDDGSKWLNKNFGDATPVVAAAETDWTVFGGNAARNAAVQWPENPSQAAWRKSIIPDPTSDPYGDRGDQAQTAVRDQLRSTVAFWQKQYRQQKQNVFPTTHPIAIGGVLLTRTISELRAIDAATGDTLWQAAADPLLVRLLTDDGRGPVPNASNFIQQLAAQRVWGDLTWGGLSSDGELVYCIEETGLRYPVRLPAGRSRQMKTFPRDRRVNRIVARDVRTFDLKWSIGGSLDEDVAIVVEPYAGTYFLGSPLPLAGHLYCLAETDGEIRLLAFQLKSSGGSRRPELVWTQPLVGANLRIDNDRLRRVAGTMLSYADGILVCPTDAGYVVAVDVTTRSLLWGYRHPSTGNRRPIPRPFPRPIPRPVPPSNRTSRWLDSTCVIDNGKVLLTPRNSDEIVCLNLFDGRVLWKKKRGDGLYVAGIRAGRALVVGSGSVRALKMADGSSAWQQAAAIATPAGRGIAANDRLLVPLSTGHIAVVDVRTGRLIDTVKTPGGRVPGNLVLAGNVLISQGVDAVEVIPTAGLLPAAAP